MPGGRCQDAENEILVLQRIVSDRQLCPTRLRVVRSIASRSLTAFFSGELIGSAGLFFGGSINFQEITQ